MVSPLFDLDKISVPKGASRDGKKLENFLEEMCQLMNALVRCAIKQTRLSAREFIARPTFADQFQDIRANLNEVNEQTENAEE